MQNHTTKTILSNEGEAATGSPVKGRPNKMNFLLSYKCCLTFINWTISVNQKSRNNLMERFHCHQGSLSQSRISFSISCPDNNCCVSL